jgi:hypothetical protein
MSMKRYVREMQVFNKPPFRSRKTPSLKWDKNVRNGRASYVATTSQRREAWDGRPYTSHEGVRVIREAQGYRIDRAELIAGSWMPWEAIDENHYPTVAAAKKAVQTYLRSRALGGR